MLYKELTSKIIDCAIRVHKELGPGLLESVYQKCLLIEFNRSQLKFEKEIALPINYKGVELEDRLRIDFVVEHKVLLELKSVKELTAVHFKQALTYMKLGRYEVGLVINFNEERIIDGIKRVVNSLN